MTSIVGKEVSLMDTLNIGIPDSLKQYIEDLVADGAYDSISDYMRELIQADQNEQARRLLESEVVKGIESGDSFPMTKADWDSIRGEALSRHEERNRGLH